MMNENKKMLYQHIESWLGCTRCPIGKQTAKKVFYRGCVPCTYLFIGEAPGPSETVTGKPFTGTAGKIFDALLESVDLLEDWGVTNTICCFPSKEDQPTKFRPPTKKEIQNCQPRLEELTECVTPNYYISLGKVAKTNPLPGLTFHLELDHPSFIARRGGINSVEFKRNCHKLKRFLQSTGH